MCNYNIWACNFSFPAAACVLPVFTFFETPLFIFKAHIWANILPFIHNICFQCQCLFGRFYALVRVYMRSSSECRSSGFLHDKLAFFQSGSDSGWLTWVAGGQTRKGNQHIFPSLWLNFKLRFALMINIYTPISNKKSALFFFSWWLVSTRIVI